MFLKISEGISGAMVKNGVIPPENQGLCRYGINQLFTILLNIAVTLSIGLLMDMVLESVLFMAAYIPLRSYAGGYHAKTPQRCCVFSGVLMAVALLAMKYVFLTFYVVAGVWIVSGIIIAVVAPVEDKNKPLDEIEVKVYRKRAMLVWGIDVLLGAIFAFANLHQYASHVAWVMTAACFMVILGKLKNLKNATQK